MTRWLLSTFLLAFGPAMLACGDDDGSNGDAGLDGGSSGNGGASAGRGGSGAAGRGGAAGRAGSGGGGRGGSTAAGSGGAGVGGRSGAGAGGAGTSGAGAGGAGTSGAGAGGAGAGGSGDDGGVDEDGGVEPGDDFSFFVTSDTRPNGNLGGLTDSDQRCQSLAAAVGFGSKTWRAYLSVESDPANGNNPTHARDRIGTGPWFNARGVMVAANLTALHSRTADAEVFIDETGTRVNGNWDDSPDPNQHDILTGSNPDGTVYVGRTCVNWTSSSASDKGQVGHSDGIGPGGNTNPPYDSWNSSHDNMDCSDTAPRGGAGKIYCFATN